MAGLFARPPWVALTREFRVRVGCDKEHSRIAKVSYHEVESEGSCKKGATLLGGLLSHLTDWRRKTSVFS